MRYLDINDIKFAAFINEYDFIVDSFLYSALYTTAYKVQDLTSGRTDNNRPTISFAGLTFTLLSDEENEKYLILK